MNILILFINLMSCNRSSDLHSKLKVHSTGDIYRENNCSLISKLKEREKEINLAMDQVKSRDDKASKLIFLFNFNMKDFINIMINFINRTSIDMIDVIGGTSIEWNAMRCKFQNIFFHRDFSSLENIIYVLEEKKDIMLEFQNRRAEMDEEREKQKIDELISYLNLNVETLIKIAIASVKNNLIENNILTTSSSKIVFNRSFELLKAILESKKIDLNYYGYNDNKSLLEIFLEDIKHYYDINEQVSILPIIIKIIERENIEKSVLNKALFHAIDLNSLDLTKLLINKGADIDKVVTVYFRRYNSLKPGFITKEDKDLIALNYSKKSPEIYSYLKSIKL